MPNGQMYVSMPGQMTGQVYSNLKDEMDNVCFLNRIRKLIFPSSEM